MESLIIAALDDIKSKLLQIEFTATGVDKNSPAYKAWKDANDYYTGLLRHFGLL